MAGLGTNKGSKEANVDRPALASTDFQAIAQATYPSDYQHFQQAIITGKLSHLYLLAGEGDGEKVALAQALAAMVLGQDDLTKQRIAAFDHPDFVTVLSEQPGAAIKIKQIRALVPELTTTALEGTRKVFVIDQADTLTTAAANSLLKFIEEPAGPQLILLLAHRPSDVLATIRSRAQVVHLRPASQLRLDHEAERLSFNQRVQPKIFKWLEKAMNRDVGLMAYLQEEVLPLVTTTEEEATVVSWVQNFGRDLMVNTYLGVDKLFFPQLAGFYGQMNKRYSAEQLLTVTDLILAVDQLRTVNISWQSRLEKLGLEMTVALG